MLAGGLRLNDRPGLPVGKLLCSDKHAQRRHAWGQDAQRAQVRDLRNFELELLVEIIERDRLEIEKAADGKPARECGVGAYRRGVGTPAGEGGRAASRCGEVPPRRPAADEEPIPVEAEIPCAPAEKRQRVLDL